MNIINELSYKIEEKHDFWEFWITQGEYSDRGESNVVIKAPAKEEAIALFKKYVTESRDYSESNRSRNENLIYYIEEERFIVPGVAFQRHEVRYEWEPRHVEVRDEWEPRHVSVSPLKVVYFK